MHDKAILPLDIPSFGGSNVVDLPRGNICNLGKQSQDQSESFSSSAVLLHNDLIVGLPKWVVCF